MFAKASKLHYKRLEIIAKLYEKLVILDMAMNDMTAMWKLVSGDKKQAEEAENKRIENAGNAYNDYQNYYNVNRIFFRNETSELLDKLREDYFDSYWTYTSSKRFGFTDFELNFANAKKASEKVKEGIPPILRKLEDDFRLIITV